MNEELTDLNLPLESNTLELGNKKLSTEEAVREVRKPENRVDDEIFVRAWIKAFGRLDTGISSGMGSFYCEILRYAIDKGVFSVQVKDYNNRRLDVQILSKQRVEEQLKGVSIKEEMPILRTNSNLEQVEEFKLYFDYLKSIDAFNQYIQSEYDKYSRKINSDPKYLNVVGQIIAQNQDQFVDYLVEVKGITKEEAEKMVYPVVSGTTQRNIINLIVKDVEKEDPEKAKMYSHVIRNGINVYDLSEPPKCPSARESSFKSCLDYVIQSLPI